MQEYLVTVVHIESDEVVKVVCVGDINAALKQRDDYEAAYSREYEVLISVLI